MDAKPNSLTCPVCGAEMNKTKTVHQGNDLRSSARCKKVRSKCANWSGCFVCVHVVINCTFRSNWLRGWNPAWSRRLLTPRRCHQHVTFSLSDPCASMASIATTPPRSEAYHLGDKTLLPKQAIFPFPFSKRLRINPCIRWHVSCRRQPIKNQE
jgi:hypothetical protein